ncbi:MAG TPA: MerC domain-containing protein [Stenotrophomonas sp.]|nr:MerC domain-containing protein [Stenotrophomonas sp.]
MKPSNPVVSPWADLSAAALSGLCLLHCLALPLGASLLPMLGAWSEAEWVHIVFVLLAAPLSVAALYRAHQWRPLPAGMWALAALGLALLTAGALAWPSARWETPITVAGSFVLVATHLCNLLRGHAH